MTDKFRYDAFIAYSKADVTYAKRIHAILSALGYRVFLDSDLSAGADWLSAIPSAQRESLATIVLVSQHSNAAFFQQAEVLRAIKLSRTDGRHRVVPVYLTTSVPPEISNVFPVEHVQGIRVADEASFLEVMRRIEIGILAAREQSMPEEEIDSRTVILVTGCHHIPELFDRSCAYALKSAIDQWGRRVERKFLRSVVMGDLFVLDQSDRHKHRNVISIGSRGINRMTAVIEDSRDQTRVAGGVEWHVLRSENRYALFGTLAEHTRLAAKCFLDEFVAGYLDNVWAGESSRI